MDYKVLAARETKRKITEHGAFVEYMLSLEGVEEEAAWFTKDTMPLPAPGSTLTGEIEPGPYGPKFKKAGGAGGGGGGGRPYKPRPDDAPEVFAARQASIARQHSQDMALRILELAQTSGQTSLAICEELGVRTISDEQKPIPLLEAISLDVSLAGAQAWAREREKRAIRAARDAA